MDPVPLNHTIYSKAKAMGATEITLEFSGGNDEGYLNVTVTANGIIPPWSGGSQNLWDEKVIFENEIERWAWEAYQYSGAGDGNDFGDDITYNLDEMTMSWSSWFMERTDGDSSEEQMEVDLNS